MRSTILGARRRRRIRIAVALLATAAAAVGGAADVPHGLIESGRVRANTGEIELDATQGWARIDTPRAHTEA